jgi:hypothetical protein
LSYLKLFRKSHLRQVFAPSNSLMKSSDSSTLALIYTPSIAGGTTLTGSLTEDGGGITVTNILGNPPCAVGVSSISTLGGTITLSNCSGNGFLTVHVDAATAKDSLNNNSTASSRKSKFSVGFKEGQTLFKLPSVHLAS